MTQETRQKFAFGEFSTLYTPVIKWRFYSSIEKYNKKFESSYICCILKGYMSFRPMQFQPMQFQPLSFQPITLSTACNFNRMQFQPLAISTACNFNLI